MERLTASFATLVENHVQAINSEIVPEKTVSLFAKTI